MLSTRRLKADEDMLPIPCALYLLVCMLIGIRFVYVVVVVVVGGLEE